MIPDAKTILNHFPPEESAWDFCDRLLNPYNAPIPEKKQRPRYIALLKQVLKLQSQHIYTWGGRFEKIPDEHLQTLGYAKGMQLHQLQEIPESNPIDFLETVIVTNQAARLLWQYQKEDCQVVCGELLAGILGLDRNQLVTQQAYGRFPDYEKLSRIKVRRLQILTYNIQLRLQQRHRLTA